MLKPYRDMRQKDSGAKRDWESTRKVALRILRYLDQNPRAADTVEGILEWWLPKQSICEEQRVVQRALDYLVEQNLLLTVQSSDARNHYHLNAERIEESRKLIRESDDS